MTSPFVGGSRASAVADQAVLGRDRTVLIVAASGSIRLCLGTLAKIESCLVLSASGVCKTILAARKILQGAPDENAGRYFVPVVGAEHDHVMVGAGGGRIRPIAMGADLPTVERLGSFELGAGNDPTCPDRFRSSYSSPNSLPGPV